MVPKDKVTRLRMTLAEDGLPKGGGVGYEIFDKSDALGTTSFVQNINHLRALEGELARTIRALDRVEEARVHLVLPDRPLFSRDKVEPSASIVLKVRGTLRAVAGPGHPPPGRHRRQRSEAAAHLDRRRTGPIARRRRRRRHDRRASSPTSAGPRSSGGCASSSRPSSPWWSGRATRASRSTADFDFNRMTQTSDKFDPEGRVVRSTQTREESAASVVLAACDETDTVDVVITQKDIRALQLAKRGAIHRNRNAVRLRRVQPCPTNPAGRGLSAAMSRSRTFSPSAFCLPFPGKRSKLPATPPAPAQ